MANLMLLILFARLLALTAVGLAADDVIPRALDPKKHAHFGLPSNSTLAKTGQDTNLIGAQDSGGAPVITQASHGQRIAGQYGLPNAVSAEDSTMTADKCLAECAQSPSCKSFEIHNGKACYLFTVNSAVTLSKADSANVVHYDVCTEFPCYVKSVYSWTDPLFQDYMLKDAMAPVITQSISEVFVCPGPSARSVNKMLKFDTAAKLKDYEAMQNAAFNFYANPDLLDNGKPKAECSYTTYQQDCWLSVFINGGGAISVNDRPVTQESWEADVQKDGCTKCAPNTYNSCAPSRMTNCFKGLLYDNGLRGGNALPDQINQHATRSSCQARCANGGAMGFAYFKGTDYHGADYNECRCGKIGTPFAELRSDPNNSDEPCAANDVDKFDWCMCKADEPLPCQFENSCGGQSK